MNENPGYRELEFEGDRVVATGTWLYGGVAPRKVKIIARDPKFAYTRWDEDDELINDAPIPETRDGSIYVLSLGSYQFFLTLEEAKAHANAQPWAPIEWDD